MYTKDRDSAGTDEKVANWRINDDALDKFYCILCFISVHYPQLLLHPPSTAAPASLTDLSQLYNLFRCNKRVVLFGLNLAVVSCGKKSWFYDLEMAKSKFCPQVPRHSRHHCPVSLTPPCCLRPVHLKSMPEVRSTVSNKRIGRSSVTTGDKLNYEDEFEFQTLARNWLTASTRYPSFYTEPSPGSSQQGGFAFLRGVNIIKIDRDSTDV